MPQTANEKPPERKSNLTLIFAAVAVLAVIVVMALALYFYSASQEKQIENIRPVSVVASAQSGPCPTVPGGECNPAGPPTWIMVNVNASSTDVPVIQLSTTVINYDREPLVCDNFGVNEKNPLMPGQNVSTTCGYRSLGQPVDLFIVNGTPAVLIEGTLQSGQSFSYWTNDTTS